LQVKRILAKVVVLNSNFGLNLNRVGVGIHGKFKLHFENMLPDL
jgi:hypothetical protein